MIYNKKALVEPFPGPLQDLFFLRVHAFPPLPAASLICSVIWFSAGCSPSALHAAPPSFFLSSCIPSLSSSLVFFSPLSIPAHLSSPFLLPQTVLVFIAFLCRPASPSSSASLTVFILLNLSLLLIPYLFPLAVFLTTISSLLPLTQMWDQIAASHLQASNVSVYEFGSCV